jgi:hypothetical protein
VGYVENEWAARRAQWKIENYCRRALHRHICLSTTGALSRNWLRYRYIKDDDCGVNNPRVSEPYPVKRYGPLPRTDLMQYKSIHGDAKTSTCRIKWAQRYHSISNHLYP